MINKPENVFQTSARWFRSSLLEVVVFSAVFLVSTMFILGNQSGGVVYSAKVAGVIILTYGLMFLYWPISLGLTVALRNHTSSWRAIYFAFFVVHSWVALSISYNGLYGLADHIDYFSPMTFAWIALMGLKLLVFVLPKMDAHE